MKAQSVSFFSNDESDKIRSYFGLQSFGIELSLKWSSAASNPNGRADLSKAVHQHARELPTFYSSISHSVDFGGYIWTTDPRVQLGFDLEKTERVSPQVAERISSSQEYAEAPSPAALWTAKEAAYKSLRGPHQPPIISEISVGNWGIWDSHYETVKIVRQPIPAKSLNLGLVTRKQLYTFAFFIFRP